MKIWLQLLCFLTIFSTTAVGKSTTSACKGNPNGICINMNRYYCPVGHKMSYSGCNRRQTCCTPYVIKTPQYIEGKDQCGIPAVSNDNKIVGGGNVDIENFPWTVSIQKLSQHVCGGSIINDEWILTAAHCVVRHADEISVVIGTDQRKLYFGQSSKRHYLSKVFRHAEYNKKIVTSGYDIALLKLSKPLSLGSTSQRRVCLPDTGESFENMICVATGWGYTKEPEGEATTRGSSKTLRQATLPILTKSRCQKFVGTMKFGTLCAGYKNGGEDTCQGDSGGPLVCQDKNGVWKQAGIVSLGSGCGQARSMGVYTEVAAFREWVDDAIDKYD